MSGLDCDTLAELQLSNDIQFVKHLPFYITIVRFGLELIEHVPISSSFGYAFW